MLDPVQGRRAARAAKLLGLGDEWKIADDLKLIPRRGPPRLRCRKH
jgi:hypothetical protein